MLSKLHLSDVTLVLVESRTVSLGLSALRQCQAGCDFHETIFFVSPSALDGMADVSDLDGFSAYGVEISNVSDYSLFILNSLVNYVKTSFVLVAQWDSWIVNPIEWRDEFFDYDYIGAVWPHHQSDRVGNGGFSLRSRRLLEATARFYGQRVLQTPIIEDDLICRRDRTFFERSGLLFAPESVANCFSAERGGWQSPAFGFHGFFNFGRVMQPTQLCEFLDNGPLGIFGDRASYDLGLWLVKNGQYSNAKKVLHKRIRYSNLTSKNIKLFVIIHVLIVWHFLLRLRSVTSVDR